MANADHRTGGSRAPGQDQEPGGPSAPSRRAALRTGTLGGIIASLTAAGCAGSRTTAGLGAAAPPPQAAVAGAQAAGSYGFNQNWLFGGVYTGGSADPGHDDSGFAGVTLPHTVTPLSWGDWDHVTWENAWIYRKHFSLGGLAGQRGFADFDGVMANATVLLNGVTVSTLFELARAAAGDVGIGPLEGVRSGGGSDGNLTAALGVPTLDGLGAVGGRPHARDEHANVRLRAERTPLLAALITRIRQASPGRPG